VKDLARDTSEINRTLRVDIDILRHINTLQDVMLKVPSDQPSIIQAYKLVFYTMDEETVNFSDAGYSQLKNSGDMRLIHFPEVADSILDYESGVKNCRDQAGYYAQQTVKLFSESKHIFQPDFGIAWWKTAITYTDTSVEQRRTPPGFYDSLSVSHPFSFMTTDPKVFQEYCSEVFIDNRVITSYVEQIQRQKRKALSLMKFLEGKYDIPVPGKPE